MGLDATICVGTFGADSWIELARERAIPSAERLRVPVIHEHGATLAKARNSALERVETPWVVFLDADDELTPGYLEELGKGSADLRAPAVRYGQNGAWGPARMPRVAGHRHSCTVDCLPEGNWLVVGTAARTHLIRSVGGWEEWPIYEDWALWLRCWVAGATVEAVPSAIYQAHVRTDSRNRGADIAFKNRIHHEIVKANLGTEVAA